MAKTLPVPSVASMTTPLSARVRPGKKLMALLSVRPFPGARRTWSGAVAPVTVTLTATAFAVAGTPQAPPVIVKTRRSEAARAGACEARVSTRRQGVSV